LECLGLIGPERPRVVCVQSEGTAPLIHALEQGQEDTVPATAGKTLAYGLNVPGGVGHFRVLEIIRESGGTAIAVTEADMTSELSAVWRDKGWWICPEGAACLAALPALREQGMIADGDRVVVFNTGSLEKYLPELRHLL
jgi:threonine synthase